MTIPPFLDGLKDFAGFAAAGGIALVGVWAKRKLSVWLENRFLSRNLKADQQMRIRLIELRVKTAADRVAIYMFHNGDHYINGNSILRTSALYEAVGPGISSEMHTAQGVLLSTIPEALEFLCVKDPKAVVDYRAVEDLPICFYRAVLESKGVRALAKYPLHRDGQIVGFINADYVRSYQPSADELDAIKASVPLLELSLNPDRRKGILAEIFASGGEL